MMLLKGLNIISQLKKVNNISTTDTSNLVKTTDYNTRISENLKQAKKLKTSKFSKQILVKIKTSKFSKQK